MNINLNIDNKLIAVNLQEENSSNNIRGEKIDILMQSVSTRKINSGRQI